MFFFLNKKKTEVLLFFFGNHTKPGAQLVRLSKIIFLFFFWQQKSKQKNQINFPESEEKDISLK